MVKHDIPIVLHHFNLVTCDSYRASVCRCAGSFDSLGAEAWLVPFA